MLRAIALALVVATTAAACATPEPQPDPGPPWREGELFEGRRRLEASAAVLGTRIVVYGGFTTSDREVPRLAITNEVLAYNTLTGTWDVMPPAPVAWTHAGLAGVGGTLFLLGGLEGEQFAARGEVFALAPGALEWTARASMPDGLARGAAAIVATQGNVYVLGGATTDGVTATCLVYSIATDTWMQLPDLPVARSHAAAMRVEDGTLIVAGGVGALGQPLGDVYALTLQITPDPPVWQIREPMPTARGGCAYGTVFGQLVCAGGESGATALRVVEMYDPTLNTWTDLPALPAERAGASGGVAAQRLHVVGGSASLMFEPTSSLFVFNLLDTIDTARLGSR
ncbi:MAG: hypothetical protein H0T89_17925 [Deltaproteobacteria bacterium]|nr:hypothetical protein [Deltaproteobacteria bacterium]MDQ3298132.1 hypothetical protein [Myxococcota bacterium]